MAESWRELRGTLGRDLFEGGNSGGPLVGGGETGRGWDTGLGLEGVRGCGGLGDGRGWWT